MRWFFIFLLKIYKAVLSPLLGKNCIFRPSCSVYAMEAYRQFGSIKGTYLTAKRVFRCGPWSAGGFDPVPHRFGGRSKWTF